MGVRELRRGVQGGASGQSGGFLWKWRNKNRVMGSDEIHLMVERLKSRAEQNIILWELGEEVMWGA